MRAQAGCCRLLILQPVLPLVRCAGPGGHAGAGARFPGALHACFEPGGSDCPAVGIAAAIEGHWCYLVFMPFAHMNLGKMPAAHDDDDVVDSAYQHDLWHRRELLLLLEHWALEET